MKYLKDLCNNINNEARNDHKLDYIENTLFDIGCRTNRNLSEWLQSSSSCNIKTSEMVVNHRKRRRALMEAENAVSSSQKS